MANDLPSPILIFGDPYLGKNNVRDAKNKYGSYSWEVIEMEKSSPEEIRFQASFLGFGVDKKIVLIQDLPNNKETREFLIRISTEAAKGVTIIIWDSTNNIKVDPKTKTFGKLWGDFVKRIKEIPGSKVINNGEEFTEKHDKDSAAYVQNAFEKRGKSISYDTAILMVGIVGRNKGLLSSEVERLSIVSPSKITDEFIIENAYPSSKEAVLWKFGNILDSCSYSKSLEMVEQFMEAGVNVNVLAEIMAKKARWQLAATSLWHQGMSWYEVENKLVEMGRFPSHLWHSNDLTPVQKKKKAEEFDTLDKMVDYLSKDRGIPSHYFRLAEKKKTSEVLPLPFLAKQITQFVQEQIIRTNQKEIPSTELNDRVFNRAIRVYLRVIDGLKEIRYNIENTSEVYDMIMVMVDRRI